VIALGDTIVVASPEQLAGRCRTKVIRHIASLIDARRASVAPHFWQGTASVRPRSFAAVFGRQDPGVVTCSDGVADRARVGWVRFLRKLCECTGAIVETTIDPPGGFSLSPAAAMPNLRPSREARSTKSLGVIPCARVRTDAGENGCLSSGGSRYDRNCIIIFGQLAISRPDNT